MAVRIRQNGRIVCAAMFEEEEGDFYLDDAAHYILSVVCKVLVTEAHKHHKERGEWWWRDKVPQGIIIDDFYVSVY